MKLSEFYCERCRDERTNSSGPRGILEYTVLPLFLIWHVRCHYCGDRYATFGLGKNRVVFKRRTSQFMRKAAVILFCGVVVAGAVALLILR